MDFTNAVLLVATVLGITQAVKSLDVVAAKFNGVLALLVGEAATFIVGASVWADEQVIGGKTLSELDTPSKAVVGLLISAGAATGWETLKSVRNIGDNQ